MKKSLLVLLLALLSFFMFAGISQAGDCIYLYSYEDINYYYDSSDVEYSGDIVFFYLLEYSCSSPTDEWFIAIDCVRRMISIDFGDWESIDDWDVVRQKLCR